MLAREDGSRATKRTALVMLSAANISNGAGGLRPKQPTSLAMATDSPGAEGRAPPRYYRRVQLVAAPASTPSEALIIMFCCRTPARSFAKRFSPSSYYQSRKVTECACDAPRLSTIVSVHMYPTVTIIVNDNVPFFIGEHWSGCAARGGPAQGV